jgi:redox-sensing transcriptional repressor
MKFVKDISIFAYRYAFFVSSRDAPDGLYFKYKEGKEEKEEKRGCVMRNNISRETLQRMAVYLDLIKSVQNNGKENISSKAIADELGLIEIQVRKDLAAVSSKGKPKVGYNKNELIRDIKAYIGCGSEKNAVLVGAGRLGRALLSYKGFGDYGFNILAAFDADKRKTGIYDGTKEILPIEELPEFCREHRIKIGIITVPAPAAQRTFDVLIENGIIAVWNFAPVHLNAPPDIIVKHENMAISLAVLSRQIEERNETR